MSETRFVPRGHAWMILQGNLGADPKVTVVPSGTKIANLRIAVNRRFKVGGEWTEATSWFSVAAFNRLADAVEKNCFKGQCLLVQGEPRMRSVEQDDGTRRDYFEVVASRILFQQMRRDQNAATEEAAVPPEEDDLP